MERSRRYCIRIQSVNVARMDSIFWMLGTHFIQTGSEKMADSETGPGESPAKKTLNTGKVSQRDGLTGWCPKTGRKWHYRQGFFSRPYPIYIDYGNRQTLIHRCSVILQALFSLYRVNATAFDNYAKETAKLFVSLYAWYYMPASVHKVWIHRSAIVPAALLPIGQLSEEAQEQGHKKIQRTLYKKVIQRIDQSAFNAKANANIGSCELFVKELSKKSRDHFLQ